MRSPLWENSKKLYSWGSWLALTMVLALFGLVLFIAALTSPPSWALMPDSVYGYLLGGALLVDGKDPYFSFHPGAGLHWLSAVNVVIISLLSGDFGNYLSRVVRDPELFLDIFGLAATLVLVVLTVVFVETIRRNLGHRAALLGSFVLISWLPMLVPWSHLLMPEFLVTLSTLAVSILAVSTLFRSSTQLSSAQTVILAIASGVGLSTKVTFLPVLILAVSLVSRHKQWLFWLASLVTTMLLLLPQASHWRSIAFQLLSQSTGNSRWYGDGISLGATLTNLLAGIQRVTFESHGGLAAVGVSVLITMGIAGSRRRVLTKLRRGPLIGLISSALLTLLIAYKEVTARDLLGLMWISAMAAGISTWALSEERVGRWALSSLLLPIFAATALFSTIAVTTQIGDRVESFAEYTKAAESWSAQRSKSNMVIGEISWSPESALAWGNDATGWQANREIGRTFPYFTQLNVWSGELVSFGPEAGYKPMSCRQAADKFGVEGFVLVIEARFRHFLDEQNGLLQLRNGLMASAAPNADLKTGASNILIFDIDEISCTN